MRIPVAAAAAALLVLAVPLPSSACSLPYAPPLRLDRTRVAPGETVRVAGTEGEGTICRITYHDEVVLRPTTAPTTPAPLLPTALPTSLPAPGMPRPAAPETPAPSAAPAEDDDPFPDPDGHVVVVFGGPYGADPAARVDVVLGRVKARAPRAAGGKRSFATTVTLPARLAPGRYRLSATERYGAWFGEARVTVGALPATGTPVAGLVQVGVLSVITGAGSLVAGRRVARRRS